MGRKYSRQGEQHVQRPCDGNVSEKWQGDTSGHCNPWKVLECCLTHSKPDRNAYGVVVIIVIKKNFFLFSPHLRNLSRMTRRAEMLPSGSGPFLMVAGAGVGSGGEKGKIQSLSPCLPVFCSYCVFGHYTLS